MVSHGIVEQIRTLLQELPSNSAHGGDDARWPMLFQSLQGADHINAIEDADVQRTILTFLNELPRVCPQYAQKADSVLCVLLAVGSWASSARGLTMEEGMMGGPLCEHLRRLDVDEVAKKVERMITRIFAGHPDADLIVPLAVLEATEEEEHRVALEGLLEDPQHFRAYVYEMVNDVASEADEPLSPAQRQRMSKKLSSLFDEAHELHVHHAELRSAYLQLVKQYHPDKGGDVEVFLALKEAYDVLKEDHDAQCSGENAPTH